MTPPVCEPWCGERRDDCYDDGSEGPRCVATKDDDPCACSDACRVAGRPVNPAPVEPKRNAPCPACGGTGGEGEWFDGCEVRCVDCGVMLMCDVAKDDGPTVFRLLDEGATDAD